MTHRVRLPGLALTVTKAASQFIGRLSTQPVAGIPEVGVAGLISDIPKHFTALAVFNLPEHLTAELEVIALLIDGVASVSIDQNSTVHARYKIVKRSTTTRRLERNIWHARKRDAPPTVAMTTAVGLFLPGHGCQVTRSLPV